MLDDLPASAQSANDLVRLERVSRFLWKRKWSLLLLIVVGAVLGAGVAQILEKRWEAVALVRVGEVTRLEPSVSVELIENPLRATERLRDPGFKRVLLERIRREAPVLERDALRMMTGLRSNLLRGADLVEVRVEGTSVEAARRLASLVVEELRRAHAELYEAKAGLLRSRLTQVDAQLRVMNSEREALDGVVSAGARGGGQGFAESVHLSSLLAKNDQVRRELSALRLELESALAPGRTFPTSLLSEIYVSDIPAFPRQPIFVAAGAVAALLLGLGSMLVVGRGAALARSSR